MSELVAEAFSAVRVLYFLDTSFVQAWLQVLHGVLAKMPPLNFVPLTFGS